MKTHLITLFISLFYLSVANGQQSLIIELESTEQPAFNKLEPQFNAIKVVGMGESTHGTHEFFVTRIEMFKYLVKHAGYNTFFLEADYANCLPINEYIKGGEGKAEELVGNIGLWPWMTEEMVDLVEWMRTYNQQSDSQLSFIGVDMQKNYSTANALVKILGDNAPQPLLAIADISAYDFWRLKKSTVKKQFLPAQDAVNKLDASVINKTDLAEYKLLVRHFNQIIDSRFAKKSSFRDLKMAENILYHLEKDDRIKGFFWAHNMHIANFYMESNAHGVAGGYLKQQLQDKYYSIGQEFYEGSFNVYSISKGQKDSEYKLGKVSVLPAAEGSLASNFKAAYNLPIYAPVSAIPQSEQFYLTNIGASFVNDQDPKSIWRYNHHGRNAFDAIVVIDKSTPTKLLQ